MNLTFDEAIANHRKMWNWIADETEKRKHIVLKSDYFKENDIPEDVFERCYCCEYGGQESGRYTGITKCSYCPIDWGVDNCEEGYSAYSGWTYCDDWQSAAKYARKIANLPAREEVRR